MCSHGEVDAIESWIGAVERSEEIVDFRTQNSIILRLLNFRDSAGLGQNLRDTWPKGYHNHEPLRKRHSQSCDEEDGDAGSSYFGNDIEGGDYLSTYKLQVPSVSGSFVQISRKRVSIRQSIPVKDTDRQSRRPGDYQDGIAD